MLYRDVCFHAAWFGRLSTILLWLKIVYMCAYRVHDHINFAALKNFNLVQQNKKNTQTHHCLVFVHFTRLAGVVFLSTHTRPHIKTHTQTEFLSLFFLLFLFYFIIHWKFTPRASNAVSLKQNTINIWNGIFVLSSINIL